MPDILQRVACKAIIANGEGKVLLLREAAYDEGTNTGLYQVPGGRINPGEPFLDGLKREILEETGMSVTPGEPIMAQEWFPVIKGVKNHIVAIFFVCSLEGETAVKLSEEHDDYKWVDRSEYKNLNIVDSESEVLDKFFGTKLAS